MLYSWEQEEAADISTFLQYWQDKGHLQSIVNNSAEDAITLMTIHKSKGLGFPVVLLPNISWELDQALSGNKENILWCPIPRITETEELTATNVTSVPLKYTTTLQMSYFAEPYFEEKLKNNDGLAQPPLCRHHAPQAGAAYLDPRGSPEGTGRGVWEEEVKEERSI